MRLIATFGTHPGVINRILASAGLPAPAPRADPGDPPPDLLWHTPRRGGAGHHRVPAPPLPPTIGNYSGLGFDMCAAPSGRDMSAWRRRSFYRAIGIYIGGADLTCPQPNLTSAWLRTETAAGWRPIPLYGGPQANLGQLVAPTRQGKDSALDAVAQARRLGFALQTPLYYDMEGFPPVITPRRCCSCRRGRVNCTGSVTCRGFTAAETPASPTWSGITAVRGYAMPDVIYNARWDGMHSTAGQAPRSSVAEQANPSVHRQAKPGLRRGDDGRLQGLPGHQADLAYISAFTSQPTPAVNLPGGGTMVFYRAQAVGSGATCMSHAAAGPSRWRSACKHGRRRRWSGPARRSRCSTRARRAAWGCSVTSGTEGGRGEAS